MAGARIKRLFDCIEAGDLEGVRALLDGGVSADSRIRYRVPLHETVSFGTDRNTKNRAPHFAIAELLLRAGADINGATREPKLSCLQLAIHDMEWVEWLLARGANPDLYNSSERDHDCLPPLMLAVRDGLVPQIQRLIAAGASTDVVCSTTRASEQNLLGVAVVHQPAEILRVLFAAARFSTGQVNEALRAAIIHDRHQAIPVLCAEGARGDYQDKDGQHTAWLAYIHRDREAIDLLRPHTAPAFMAALDAWSGRAVLGVSGCTPEQAAALVMEAAAPAGAIVHVVHPDSAAARLELRPRDIITKIDEHPVDTLKELQRLLATYRGGDVVRISYVRDGVTCVATGPLGAAAFGE
jgi:hypothetical protein